MKNIKKINDVVLQVLKENKVARNSDNELYLEVCERFNPAVMQQPFGKVFAFPKYWNIPSFKSVERVRRKVQAHHPELASDKKIEAMRKEKEEEYRKFAKGIL